MLKSIIIVGIFLSILGLIFYGLYQNKKNIKSVPDESNDIIKDKWKEKPKKKRGRPKGSKKK